MTSETAAALMRAAGSTRGPRVDLSDEDYAQAALDTFLRRSGSLGQFRQQATLDPVQRWCGLLPGS